MSELQYIYIKLLASEPKHLILRIPTIGPMYGLSCGGVSKKTKTWHATASPLNLGPHSLFQTLW